MGFELPKAKNLENRIFRVSNEKEFELIALAVFQFQYLTNPTYQAFCNALQKNPEEVQSIVDIPFLPIQFFKSRVIQSGNFKPAITFSSSGTTGTQTSRHPVKDLLIYEQSFITAFEKFYGRVEGLCILGLLPSYLEREGSSLIYMVNFLIEKSGHSLSGFYLHNHQQLQRTLLELEQKAQPTILFGVSYALLDFAESFPTALRYTIVIETGGMKGRKKEIPKPALYESLRQSFSTTEIHSEYGMTELLSQAYAVNGRYQTPPWMKVLLREETDPFSYSEKNGAINIIDLANLYSCSFIATDDRGKGHHDGTFEVLGRLDNSDIRGCSQLI